MNGNPVVVSQSQEEEVDRSLWKLLLLALFTVILSTGTVYYFNEFLLSGRFSQFLLSAVIGGFFLAFVVLNALFIKNAKRLQAVMILTVISPLGFYYGKLYPNPSWILLLSAAVYFIFLSLATYRGFKSLNMSLQVRFSHVAKVVLPKAATGLLIFLSVFVYLQYFEWGKFDEKVGKNLVFQTLSASEPIVKIFYSNFSFNQSVGRFLSIIAESQLKNARPDFLTRITSDLPLDFSKLSQLVKTRLIGQVTDELKKSLANLLGPFDDQTTVKDYIFELTKNRINNFSLQVKSIFGIIVAVSVFFALKGLEVPLRWLTVFTGFLIYKILVAVNFAHLSLETRSREFVVLT